MAFSIIFSPFSESRQSTGKILDKQGLFEFRDQKKFIVQLRRLSKGPLEM